MASIEPVLCSSPTCSRPAEARFGWRCKQCFDRSNDKSFQTSHKKDAEHDFQNLSTAAGTSPVDKMSYPGIDESGDATMATGAAILERSFYSSEQVATSLTSKATVSDQAGWELKTDWKRCSSPLCNNTVTGSPFGKGLCMECFMKSINDPVKCLTPGCDNNGLKEMKSFCSACFNSNLNLNLKKVATKELESDKCVTPGCPYYGSPEQSGMCSSCLKNYLSSETAASPAAAQTSSHPRCKTRDCDFYGNPAMQGLCSTCFRVYLEDPPSVASGRRRHASDPSCRNTSQCNPESIVSGAYLTVPGQERSDQRKHIPSKTVPAPILITQYQLLNDQGPTHGDGETIQPQLYDRGIGTQSALNAHMSLTSSSNSTTVNSELSTREDIRPLLNPFAMYRSTSSPDGFVPVAHRNSNEHIPASPHHHNTSRRTQYLKPPDTREPPAHPAMHTAQSNPDLSSISDMSEEKRSKARPVIAGTSDMCKASPSANVTGVSDMSKAQGVRPSTNVAESSGCPRPPVQGDQRDTARTEKKKVSFKLIILDPLTISCDVMICLWNKHDIDAASHPLLTQIGNVVKDFQKFKMGLMLDQVCETDGGTSKAKKILHCKYDEAADRPIAKAILRCFIHSERELKAILPVIYLVDLNNDPKMATRVCMYVIANLQNSSNYTQTLQKFYLCLKDTASVNLCKEEFVFIQAKRQRNQGPKEIRPNCHECKINPSVKLKPVSLECSDDCTIFCMPCLKHGRERELTCPRHGECLPPVGHKNSFALLVSGYDANSGVAKIFIDDMQTMKRVLSDKDFIGVRDENVMVVQAREPGKQEDIRGRLLQAFSFLREKMSNCNHAVFYFYYSGHNNKKALKLGGEKNVISPKELKRELRHLNAETILIMLDCCYSAGTYLAEEVNDEDFMTSLNSYSKDEQAPLTYVPKLWNIDEDVDEDSGAKGPQKQVFQWSSSVADEKSFFKDRSSLFTKCIVQALKGRCPSKIAQCRACKTFREKVLLADGVFLGAISETVECHVPQLAENMLGRQHPQLDASPGAEEDQFLFAFHVLHGYS